MINDGMNGLLNLSGIIKVTSGNRITLPTDVRQYLHLRPGTQVEFELRDDGSFIIRPVEEVIAVS